MTTPAIVETAAVLDPHSPTAQSDAMEATIKASLSQAADVEAVAVPRGTPGRDPVTGKFTADPGVQGAQPIDEASAPEGVVPPPVVIPDGYVAATPIPEDQARGFTVRDKDGEILAPDLTWEFVANGKPRMVNTATLMQYAQHGVYNHEREQQRVQTEAQSQHVIAYARQLESQAQANATEKQRLLSDPDYLIRELTRYEEENTPEARQQKERQQLEQEKEHWQLQQMAQQSETYITNTLEPAVEQIITALPTISKEEIAAKLFVIADRYRVNGVLHPNGHDPVGRALVNEILPWAQQVHASRQADRAVPIKDAAAAAAKAKADVEAAKIRAQKARRQGTPSLRPTGSFSPGSSTPKPIRNAKDAEDAVIGNSLAAMRGG